MSPPIRGRYRPEGTPAWPPVPGVDGEGREMQEEQMPWKQQKKEAGGKPLDRVSRPRTNPRWAASGMGPTALPRTYRRVV